MNIGFLNVCSEHTICIRWEYYLQWDHRDLF